MSTTAHAGSRPGNGPDAAGAPAGSARTHEPLQQAGHVEEAERFERNLARILERRLDAPQRGCRIVGATREAMRRATRRGEATGAATAALVAVAVRVVDRCGAAGHAGTLPDAVQLVIGGVLDTTLELGADLESAVTAAIEAVVDAAGDGCLRDVSRDDVTIAVRACLLCAAYVLGELHGKEARARITTLLLSPRPTCHGATSDPTASAA
ncbi:MAG: hypothetical protein PVF43_00410 [Candidatus Eiseniibacteriota bacterium]|jgi:hypothetical protein